MNINIINSISNTAISGLKSVANSKAFNSHFNNVQNNPVYAARFLVLGNVSKDVFAYSLRAYQTINNKEIPNDKKPFMAALDLMSGAVTGLVQVGIGFALSNEKVQNKAFSLLFGNVDKNNPVIKKAKAGFIALSTLICSMIIAKRLIVAAVSTPLASYFKEKFFNEKVNSKIEPIKK